MSDDFVNATTRKTLNLMVGNMYPSEMADLVEDAQVRETDVPDWIERTLRANCKYVIARLPRYETLIRVKYGEVGSLIKKLAVYHTVRDNFDGLEPCDFDFMKPIYKYYDWNLDREVKAKIDQANSEMGLQQEPRV